MARCQADHSPLRYKAAQDDLEHEDHTKAEKSANTEEWIDLLAHEHAACTCKGHGQHRKDGNGWANEAGDGLGHAEARLGGIGGWLNLNPHRRRHAMELSPRHGHLLGPLPVRPLAL